MIATAHCYLSTSCASVRLLLGVLRHDLYVNNKIAQLPPVYCVLDLLESALNSTAPIINKMNEIKLNTIDRLRYSMSNV